MAITEAEKMRQFAVVRRLEAAGFRAWPATTTGFDGTWAVRLTRSFPAKRLNSINPLDPSDRTDIPERLARARKTFAEAGRTVIVRQSPLAPPELVAHLDAEGWQRFAETIVMTAESGDGGFFRFARTHPDPRYHTLSRGEPCGAWPSGFACARASPRSFRRSARPVACSCAKTSKAGPWPSRWRIQDNDLAGLLDVAVDPECQRQGIGIDLVKTALRYSAHKGAKNGLGAGGGGQRARPGALRQARLQGSLSLRLSGAAGRTTVSGAIVASGPARRLLLVVACALIDADGRVLIAQRPEGKSLAGLWEFPGGKVEPGETPEAALIRELARGTRHRDVGQPASRR